LRLSSSIARQKRGEGRGWEEGESGKAEWERDIAL